MDKAFLLQLLFAATLGVAGALEVAGTEEGSCKGVESIPTHSDVDPTWLDSLRYVTAGSKFQLYTKASSHPGFQAMREFEFYYNACLYKNVSFPEGRGTQYGFGGINLGEFDIEPSADSKAIEDAYPIDPHTGTRLPDFFRIRVTLTDYRTFAVLHNCFQGPNQDQKAWDVYSVTPELDEATQKLIENHVVSIGFKRENVIFFQRGKCQYPDRPVSNRPGHTAPPAPVPLPSPLPPGKFPGSVNVAKPTWGVPPGNLQGGIISAKNDIPNWGVNRLKTLTTTHSPPVTKKETSPPVVLEKTIPPMVLNKYVPPVVLNKGLRPNPISPGNKYVPPVVLGKINPSEDSKKFAPIPFLNKPNIPLDAIKYVPHIPIDNNSKYVPTAIVNNPTVPSDPSKYIPPVVLNKSVPPIVLKRGNPVEPIANKDYTFGQQGGPGQVLGQGVHGHVPGQQGGQGYTLGQPGGQGYTLGQQGGHAHVNVQQGGHGYTLGQQGEHGQGHDAVFDGLPYADWNNF